MRLLPSIFEELGNMQNLFSSCCRSTGLTLSEDETKVYVDAAIPGVKSEDVEVTIDHEMRTLQIRAKSKLKRENVQYLLKSSDCYTYEIPLSQAVDISKPIEASCKDGILTVELSKSSAPKPLKIEVKVA